MPLARLSGTFTVWPAMKFAEMKNIRFFARIRGVAPALRNAHPQEVAWRRCSRVLNRKRGPDMKRVAGRKVGRLVRASVMALAVVMTVGAMAAPAFADALAV